MRTSDMAPRTASSALPSARPRACGLRAIGPTRPEPWGWWASVVAGALLAPLHPVVAQEPMPRLTLGEAVAAALEHNRDLASGRRQLDLAQGEALAARGAYDFRVRTTVGDTRQERRVFDAAGEIAAHAVPSRSFTYELGLARELPGGLVVQPGLSLTRTDDPLAAPAPFAQAGAQLGLVLPLDYNRGGRLTRAALRVAELGVDASGHRLRQLASGQVREVVGAYWEYRAAHERLEVYRSSEARAIRLLEETRTLVAAQERPRSDLNQVQANVASKRMSRLAAEQQRLVVQQRLAMAMGLDAGAAEALPLPADAFPEARPFRADAGTLDRLAALALAQRAELAVAGVQAHAARLRLEAAQAAQRPSLDLTVGLGYVGLTTAADLGGVLAPLYRDIPGLNATLQLSYQAALANRQARGRVLQGAAAHEQQKIAYADVRERILAAVYVAATGLERGLAILEASEDAARLYHTAVDNEKRKYALGVATLFDVILAEDNLTNTLLAGVDGRLNHALALAGLRYETGSLLDGHDAEVRFAAATATSIP